MGFLNLELFLPRALGSLFVLPRSGEWIFRNRNLLGQEPAPKNSIALLTVFLGRTHFLRLLFKKISAPSVAKGFLEQPVPRSNGISLLLCFANENTTAGQDFLLAKDDPCLRCSVRFLVSHTPLLDGM